MSERLSEWQLLKELNQRTNGHTDGRTDELLGTDQPPDFLVLATPLRAPIVLPLLSGLGVHRARHLQAPGWRHLGPTFLEEPPSHHQ